MCELLGMSVVYNPGVYLGLPTIWGRSKGEALRFELKVARIQECTTKAIIKMAHLLLQTQMLETNMEYRYLTKDVVSLHRRRLAVIWDWWHRKWLLRLPIGRYGSSSLFGPPQWWSSLSSTRVLCHGLCLQSFYFLRLSFLVLGSVLLGSFGFSLLNEIFS